MTASFHYDQAFNAFAFIHHQNGLYTIGGRVSTSRQIGGAELYLAGDLAGLTDAVAAFSSGIKHIFIENTGGVTDTSTLGTITIGEGQILESNGQRLTNPGDNVFDITTASMPKLRGFIIEGSGSAVIPAVTASSTDRLELQLDFVDCIRDFTLSASTSAILTITSNGGNYDGDSVITIDSACSRCMMSITVNASEVPNSTALVQIDGSGNIANLIVKGETTGAALDFTGSALVTILGDNMHINAILSNQAALKPVTVACLIQNARKCMNNITLIGTPLIGIALIGGSSQNKLYTIMDEVAATGLTVSSGPSPTAGVPTQNWISGIYQGAMTDVDIGGGFENRFHDGQGVIFEPSPTTTASSFDNWFT